MGVVHKLKPEVIKFILDNKQANPNLSCRNFTSLVMEKLQVKVSKSSINDIFKEHSLSMPVGRRQKPKRKKFNMPDLPVIESNESVAVQEIEQPRPKIKTPPVQPEALNNIVPQKEDTLSPEDEKKLLEEERIKEAEAWALKLHEEECKRIEEERLRNTEAQRIIEEEHLARQKAEAEEELRKAAEEKAKEEQIKLQRAQEEEARLKQAEKLRLDEEARKLREKEALTIAAEAKEKEEQERLLKAAQEEEARQKALAKVKLEEEKKNKEEALDKEPEIKEEQQVWARLEEEKLAGVAPASKKEEPEFAVLPSLPSSRDCSGAVLLKAVDGLIQGSSQFAEIIQERLNYAEKEAMVLTQSLIFQGMVNNDLDALSAIVGKQISAERLNYYFDAMQRLPDFRVDLARMISSTFNQARGIKMHFIEGSVVYLDAQMHTVWSTPYTPYDFSATVSSVKDQVNRYFFEDGNLILFMAPGFDIPTKEFFTLLMNFSQKSRSTDRLILYDNKMVELGTIVLNSGDNRGLAFALWPWQFTAYRKVNRIGEFDLHHIECLSRDMYLAEVEISLLQPTTRQSISLKGCAIKLDPAEKIRLVVLGINHLGSLEALANNYFCHWPNLDEGFKDFSRKMELFTYTGELQPSFVYDNLPIAKQVPADLKGVFANYAEALDAYLRWHFMPAEYEKIDFQVTRERFYSQKAQLTQVKNKMHYSFVTAPGYTYAKELGYICRRLNERDVRTDNGQKVHFESAF